MATRKLSKALSPRLKPEPMSPSPKPAPRQRGSMLSALSPRMTTSPDEGHDEGRDNDLPTPASPSAQRATSLRKQTEEVPVSHHPSPTVSSVSMDRPAPSVSSPRQGRIFTFDDEAIKATPVPTPRHRPKSVIDKNHAGPNDGLASTNVMYQGSVKQTDCKPKPAERNRNAKDKVVHAHLVTISPDPVELKSEVQAAKAPCNEAGGPKRLKSPVHPNDSVKNLRAANRMATRLSDSVLSTGDNPPPHRQFVSSAARMFEQKASENSSSSTLPRSTRSSVSVSSVVQSFNRNSEFDSASTSGRATRRPSESVYGRPVNNSTLSGNDRRRSTASPLSGPSSLYRSMPDLSTVHDSSVTRSRNLRLDDSDPNRFSRVNSSGKAKQDTSNTTSLKSVLASRDGLPEWPPSVGKKDKSRVTSSVSSVTLRSQSPVHDSHSACSRSNRLSWSSQSSDTHISRFTVPSSSLRRSAYFGSTPSLAPTTELSEKHVQSAMKQFDDLLSDKHTMDSDDELPKVSNSVSLDLHKLRSRGRVETNVKSSEQSPAKAELVHKAEAEIMQKTKTAPSLKDDSVSGQKSETVQVKRVENVQVEKTVAVLPSCEKSPVSVVVEQRKTMSKKESDDRTASAESRSPRKFVFGQGSNPDIQLIVKSTKSVAVAAKDSAVHVTTQEPVENQPEKCNENHIKTVSVHKAEDEKLCSTSYQPENLPDKTVSVTKTVASRPVEVKKPEQDGTSVELLSQEGHNTGQSPKVIDDIVDAYPEEDVAAALDIAIVEQSFHTKQSHSVIDNAVCEETAPSPTQTIMVEEQNVVNINTEERKDDGDSDDDSSPPPLPEEGPPPLPSAPPPMLATTSNVDTVGEKLMLPAQEATYRPSQVVGDKAEVAPVGDDQSYDVEQVVDERSDPSYNVPMEQNLAWKSNIPMEQNLVLQNSTSMEQNRVLQNSMSMEEQQSTSTGSDLISFPSSQLPTPSLPLTTHTDLLPRLDLLKKSNDEENSQDNPPVSDTLSQDSGVQDEDMSEDGLRFSQDESPSSTGLFESVMTPDDISAPLLTESKNDQPLQTEAAVETISVSKSPVPSPRRSLHATSRSPVPHMTSLTAQESTAVQSSQNSPRVDNVIDSVPQGSVSPRCSSGQQETEVSTLRGGVSTTGEDNEHIVSSGDKTASVQLVSDNAVSVDKADDVKVSGEKCYRLETKRDNAVSMQHEVIDVHKYTEESQNADGNSVEKQSVDTDTGSPPDSPNAPNSPTEEDDNEVLSEEENSFSELAKITSSRRWCILDQSGSLFLQGGNGCPVDVDRPTLRQISSMMPSQFDSMLTSGNKDLDSAQLPVSVELMVVSARELSGKAVRVDVYQREDYFVQVTNVISKGSSVLEADLLLSVEGRTLRNRRPAQVHRLLEDTGPKGIILIARGLKLPSSAVRMTETHTEERANTPPATHTPVPSPAPTPTSTPVQVGEGIYEVTLAVGPTGVGFCLEGGKASLQGDLPILIKRIFKGTLADKGGFLKAKDEILSVNGVDFTTMGHYEAWNHLKALKDGEIRLRIKKHE